MSLSASLPVNSAAAPTGAAPPGAAGAPADAATGLTPASGTSVFDALLQQIAAETPVQAAPAIQAAMNGEMSAVLTTEETGAETPEAEVPETVEAEIPGQVALVITAPVVQPQANTAEAAPELSQDALPVDAKASRAKPGQAQPVGGKDADDIKDAETADTMETAVKASVEPLRAAGKAARDVVAKVRDAVTGAEPQPAQPAADPRTVSASAPDASSSAMPSAFSLQALNDTQGSYTATGASTAAASNLSKAAVETLSALSMQISKKLEHGSTRFAIELYPADLGKVEVSLHIARDGKTTAHLTFDSPVTAASFSASEPELRQQLANAGLSVDQDALSFSSRDGSSQGNGFGSALAQDQQQQQSQARQASRALEAARKVADDSDLNAVLDRAMNAMRGGASTLALNLIV